MKKDRSKQLEPTEKQWKAVRNLFGAPPILEIPRKAGKSAAEHNLEYQAQLRNNNKESALDTQVGGDHYIKHTIQPWDIIDEYDLGYYGGNALKYLLRDKGDRKEDLEKARHYIAKMIGDLRE